MEPNDQNQTVEPSTQPKPTAGSAGVYISNPLAMFMPSWNAIKLNLGSLIAVLVIPAAILIAAMAVTAAGAIATANILTFLVMIPLILVAFAVIAPAATLIYLAGVKGEKLGAKDAFSGGLKFAVRYLGVGILTALAVIAGFFLLIIPGLIFAAWFSLSVYALMEEDLGVIDSMKRSKELVKGRVWEMFGLMSFGPAISILNLIPVLGPIATTLGGFAYSAAGAIRYTQLKEYKASGQLPPVHSSNYAIIALAVVSTFVTGQYGPEATDTELEQQFQDFDQLDNV